MGGCENGNANSLFNSRAMHSPLQTPFQILVWKELNYGQMREKEKQLVVSEVNILRELRHPFIVRYYDRIIDKAATKIYIVMEFCEGGDLGGLIKKCKKEGYVPAGYVWCMPSSRS